MKVVECVHHIFVFIAQKCDGELGSLWSFKTSTVPLYSFCTSLSPKHENFENSAFRLGNLPILGSVLLGSRV